MNWYLKVLKQYTDFSGRARRKEYWMYTLFNVLFSIAAMVIDNVLGLSFELQGQSMGYGYVYVLYVLFVLIPGLAVAVRRLHDVGKSGWFLLIGLIPLIGSIWLLVLFCTDGESNSNKWGNNPKAGGDEINEIGVA